MQRTGSVRMVVGDEVHLRGIVEFSNFCAQNCLYCGLRRDNHALVRYRMSLAEIVAAAKSARARGSGRSSCSREKIRGSPGTGY